MSVDTEEWIEACKSIITFEESLEKSPGNAYDIGDLIRMKFDNEWGYQETLSILKPPFDNIVREAAEHVAIGMQDIPSSQWAIRFWVEYFVAKVNENIANVCRSHSVPSNTDQYREAHRFKKWELFEQIKRQQG